MTAFPKCPTCDNVLVEGIDLSLHKDRMNGNARQRFVTITVDERVRMGGLEQKVKLIEDELRAAESEINRLLRYIEQQARQYQSQLELLTRQHQLEQQTRQYQLEQQTTQYQLEQQARQYRHQLEQQTRQYQSQLDQARQYQHQLEQQARQYQDQLEQQARLRNEYQLDDILGENVKLRNQNQHWLREKHVDEERIKKLEMIIDLLNMRKKHTEGQLSSLFKRFHTMNKEE